MADKNSPSPTENFDVIIVGGGPIGISCGIEAEKRNLRYKIIEKGCLVNSIYHFPANMTFFSTSERIEMGGVPFVSHGPKPTRREALEYYRRVVKKWDLDISTYEKVENIDHQDGIFLVTTARHTYRAESVVLATGFFDLPNLMDVPGEDLPKVKHYYDDPHPYIDRDVIVVGAANSAVDAALEVWRKGGRVTMVIRGEEISPRVKYWIKPDIDNRIKEGSIKAYFHSTIRAIYPHKVEIETPEGAKTLKNDFVLALTGYRPDFDWLEKVGVKMSDDGMRTPQRDPDTFETDIPGLFLAGTVCGGMNTNKWYIENSIEHAAAVMERIVSRLPTKV